MAESGSEIQQPKGRFTKVLGAFKGALKSFEIDSKPTPVEEMTPRNVAKIINSMRNPLREDDQVFDVTTVLQNMNYFGSNQRVKHPEAYEAARKAMLELQHRNVLDVSQMEEENQNHETSLYRVANESMLQDLVKGSTGGK